MTAHENYIKAKEKLLAKYYQNYSDAASKKKLTAHVTGFLPFEVLVAMDIFPFYPEGYATRACNTDMGDELVFEAEKAGVSRDLCAFSTCALGSMYSDKGPQGGMIAPDLLISSAYTCGAHVPWWELMHQHYKVPLFIIDGPVLCADYEERHIDFYISQTKELISFLEKETGKDFDEDRFEKVVELSSDACEYFHKVIELRKNSPSPVGFRQLFADMFGLVNVTGEQETLDFYKAFYEETLEKKENNIGVAEHEEYRLIWDNLPIYHDMDLFDYFESKGMVFVYETLLKEYFAKGLDKSDPFRGLAKKYLTGWTNRRLDRKIEIVEEAVKEYRVDGIVVFENKGCRGYSTGQLDVAKSLKEKIGIPNMIVEGSMADPGSHDPNKFRSMVDMFHEVLKSQSAGGR